MGNTNQAVLKDHPKNKDFAFLYLKNVPVVYARIHEPRQKHLSEEMEYTLTAFVNETTRDYLLDDVLVNKELLKVGVDKNKKRKIKYPLSSQREDGKTVYDPFEGLYGISLTLNARRKNGDKASVNVVDKEGKPITDLVGNGSICNIKCFGYRNQDEQLVIMLDVVQVVDLSVYEPPVVVEDEELGINIPLQKKTDTTAPLSSDDDFDSDIPF